MTTAASIASSSPARPDVAGKDAREDRLPLSKKAVAAIAAANSWEQDRIAQALASGRRGWIAAGVGGALAVLGFSMATFQSLRPQIGRASCRERV